jgi:SAM-dependent methyltransferase
VDHSWEQSEWVRMEMVPTLQASAPLQGVRVLELGAGTGRYSVPMARQGAQLLAADFSFGALRALADRIEPGWQVGLIEADCAQLRIRPASFDLVASTLISNLPTAPHRHSVYRLAAAALREGGRFVFSAHHHSWRSRWSGEAQSGHYKPGGIYRYLFRRREICREVRQHFGSVACRPVQIHVPLSGRLGLMYRASRLAERIWPLNRLGELLLVAARRPVRSVAALLVPHLPALQELMSLTDGAAVWC